METRKTSKNINFDKFLSIRINNFFRNLALWGGFETKKNLAKTLGVHPSIFLQYENKTGKISVPTAKKIIEAFPNLPKNLKDELLFLADIDQIYLEAKPIEEKIPINNVDFTDETVNVEYITSKVNAGNGYVEMNFPVTIKMSKFLIKKHNPEDIFAVTAQGDSMLKRGITDGTMLIVKKSTQVEEIIGQIVVCICDAEFLVKKLVQNAKGDLELHSESYTDYPPIELKHRAFRIFGYVIHSINDYN